MKCGKEAGPGGDVDISWYGAIEEESKLLLPCSLGGRVCGGAFRLIGCMESGRGAKRESCFLRWFSLQLLLS